MKGRRRPLESEPQGYDGSLEKSKETALVPGSTMETLVGFHGVGSEGNHPEPVFNVSCAYISASNFRRRETLHIPGHVTFITRFSPVPSPLLSVKWLLNESFRNDLDVSPFDRERKTLPMVLHESFRL